MLMQQQIQDHPETDVVSDYFAQNGVLQSENLQEQCDRVINGHMHTNI